MADDTPKGPDDAPEGFWDEFAQHLGKTLLSEDSKKSMFEGFLTEKGKLAPAPNPNDPPADPPADPPSKKKGWF
jgi:hypothetical protein